ncbi:MAG: ABC transporter permease, partial [Phycisphaerae bacterium]
PFPMDLSLIRDKDEKYWDAHHATPKAFITLTDGQRLWAEGHERFGRLTAIQVEPTDGATLAEVRARFERGLLRTLDPTLMGFSVDAVRTRMMRAGEGTTDFGMLFVSFSFFLIASAAMLVALLFRLGAEGRAREVGLLLATGFMPRTVTRMLISEGTILAVVGSAVGTAAALSYAWLMLTGLRTWWSAAANAPFLRLYAAPITLIIGFACGVLVALLSIAWSLRGLSRRSPRSLLAGAVAAGGPARAMGGTGKRQLARAGAPSFSPEKGGGRTPGAVAKLGEDERGHARLAPDPSRVPGTSRGVVMTALAFAVALFLVLLPLLTDALPETGAFFGSGSALLIGSLLLYSLYLGREQTVVVRHGGWTGWIRLGARHARRRPGRSVLTTAMIASATFLVSSLEAFHLDVGTDPGDRHSGTGGFCLYAESSVPLPFDLNTPEGRESLNIRAEARALLSDVNVLPYRLRPGDESSCLNLYRPTRPRILGAPEAAIARGGFTFSTTLAETDTEKENPWLLLSGDLGDNVIPVIGDEAAVKWQLHLGLGKELTVTAESGAKRRLRFVALLKGSVLQDELIIAESHFVQLFPSITGHAFFLIDTPPATADNVEPALERELAPFGFDIRSTTRRLADYLAVQNTYLSTFQTLGGFGLILGTVGLAAVLLRNVLERRGELALMRALGFSRAALGWIVFSENASLLLMGLATGVASAALAVAPHVIARPAALPWTSLGFTLGLVSLTGLVAVGAATALSLRGPLLPALRSE